MLEAGYQSKIIKEIEKMGGHAINGTYSKSGEADLQCGIPMYVGKYMDGDGPIWEQMKVLLHVAIEVKTEKDYDRVMRAIDDDYNIINSTPLKKHEPLQMAKIRRLRKKGGLALVAFNIKQVMEYVHGRFNTIETNN